MSFFADLFSPSNWFSSASSQRGTSFLSQPSSASHGYSVRELERLHEILLSEDKLLSQSSSRSLSSLSSGHHRHQKYIEALRAISEIVVWADQRTEDKSDEATLEQGNAIVEYFLSRHMVKYFHEVLAASADDDEVVTQVLQTMNILIQNLQNEQTVYCLFSNNHVNEILSMDSVFLAGAARGTACDGGDVCDVHEPREEVLGLYVNLLKTIVLRLDEHSVEFFIKEGRACVPYTRALRVAELDVAREDGMVRAAVRAVVLKLVTIVPTSVFSVCMGGPKTKAFFRRLCDEVLGTMVELEMLLRDEQLEDGRPMTGNHAYRIDSMLCRLEDDMAFFNDLLRTMRTEVCQMVLEELWPRVVLGSIAAFHSAHRQSSGSGLGVTNARARMLMALLVLEAVCKAVDLPSLSGLLVTLLLSGDSFDAAKKVAEELQLADLTVDDLLGAGGKHENTKQRDVIDQKGLRDSVISSLVDDSVDQASLWVLLRLLAAMLDASVPLSVLTDVGLLSASAGDLGRSDAIAVNGNHTDDVMNVRDESIASYSVGSAQLLKSELSVCFPGRCAELQGAIFHAAIGLIDRGNINSRILDAHVLTCVTWIFKKMLGRGSVLLEVPIGRLQEFLARAHDSVLLCIPGSTFSYATPTILNHCWSAQQRYLETFKPRQAPSKLSTTAKIAVDGHEKLHQCLECATRFVALYQLYLVVAKGEEDLGAVSPFPAVYDGKPADRGIVAFRTSCGTLDLGPEMVTVRDEAQVVLFEAPISTVVLNDADVDDSRQVNLTSNSVEVVRGLLRVRSGTLRGLTFESRLERAFVENAVREARQDAEELSRVYLEHCSTYMM